MLRSFVMNKRDEDNPNEAPPAQSAAAICADPTLTREQKIQRLIDMCRDALELEVATGEGMAPPDDEASGLGRIHRALEELGAADRIPPNC
jgi:hypothetical protein